MRKSWLVIFLIAILSLCSIFLVGCSDGEDDNVYGIYVSKSPDKVVYYAGESLDISGCEITVRTKNRKDYTIPVTEKMVSGFSSALGNHTLTITYTIGDSTFITTQSITVSTKKAVSAKIIQEPDNTLFVEGQIIDLSGLVAEVTFSDKSIQERYFQAFTPNKRVAELGLEEIELKLDSVVLTIPITVVQKRISGIKMITPPTKSVYEEGEIFDPKGMEIYTIFNDGSLDSVIEFVVINYDVPLSANQNYVTIREKYSAEFTLDIPILVNAINIESLALDQSTVRTMYIVGSKPDYSTIKALITFSDSSQKIVDYTALNFTPDCDAPLTEGTVLVKVSYKYASQSDKFDYFTLTVSAEKVAIGIRIEKKNSFNPNYLNGEDISLVGLNVFILFNDSSEEWAVYSGEINENIANFEYTATADANNPIIEFRCGEVSQSIDIIVNQEEDTTVNQEDDANNGNDFPIE